MGRPDSLRHAKVPQDDGCDKRNSERDQKNAHISPSLQDTGMVPGKFRQGPAIHPVVTKAGNRPNPPLRQYASDPARHALGALGPNPLRPLFRFKTGSLEKSARDVSKWTMVN